MKFHIAVATVLLSGLLLPYSNEGLAESNVDKAPISRIWDKEKPLDMVYMKTRGKGVLCIAASHVKKMDGSPYTYQKLIFYKGVGNSFTKIHEFEPGGGTFLGFHVLYNGELMTLWAGASAFGVFVFAVAEDQVRVVIQEGGVKTNPEIADIDNDGLPELLISSGSAFRSDRIYPEMTSIYKLDGMSYIFVKRVPWEQRFSSPNPRENSEK